MESNTSRRRELLLLCLGYFSFYCMTGLLVKLFTGSLTQGFFGLNEMEYLLYNTLGGNLTCLVVIVLLGWARFSPAAWVSVFKTKFRVPREFAFLIPSGLCTAVVIPATTLLYMLPISVMVAMVIMRGSIIVVSRIVDEIQIRQGLLEKKVVWQENVAVIFALLAVGTKIFFSSAGDHFAFVKSIGAMSILGSYIFAYSIRIYIMNYYKNTRRLKANNHAFFAWEQVFCTLALLILLSGIYFFTPQHLKGSEEGFARVIGNLISAIDHPHARVVSASLSGIPYGILAFFSVFLFMFGGKTATFNGLVNRLTSLLAGTASTLLLYFLRGGHFPGTDDWLALGFIFIAIGLLAASEDRAPGPPSVMSPLSPRTFDLSHAELCPKPSLKN